MALVFGYGYPEEVLQGGTQEELFLGIVSKAIDTFPCTKAILLISTALNLIKAVILHSVGTSIIIKACTPGPTPDPYISSCIQNYKPRVSLEIGDGMSKMDLYFLTTSLQILEDDLKRVTGILIP
ncbi:hypothetical protein ACJX0J_022942 [Zea mays]